MATETIDIVVRKYGDAAAAAGVEKIGDAADKTEKQVKAATTALDFFQRMLKLVAAAFAVEKLREYSDTFSGLISRLKLVSKDTDDLRRSEQALFEISQRTRSSYEATMNLYAKMANAMKDTQTTQKDLLLTTELINKAIIVSGTSAENAKAGLIQLSQGLASGTLRGDELNSVLENMPYLAEQIAKGMDSSIGQIRKLGEEGKITSKSIIDALEKRAPDIQKAFAQVTPTISQAMTVLNNAMLRYIGLMDQGTGVSRTIASAIIFLGDNFNTLAGVVGTAVAAFVAFKAVLVAQALMSWVAGLSAINLATITASASTVTFSAVLLGLRTGLLALFAIVAANPFTVFLTVIALATAAIYNFGNSIKIGIGSNITLLGMFSGAFNYLWSVIQTGLAWGGEFLTWVTNSKPAVAALSAAVGVLTLAFITMQLPTLLIWLASLYGAIGRLALALMALAANPISLVIIAFTGAAVATAYFTGTLDKLIVKGTQLAAQVGNNLKKAMEDASKQMDKTANSALNMKKNTDLMMDSNNQTTDSLKKNTEALKTHEQAQNEAEQSNRRWIDGMQRMNDELHQGTNDLQGYGSEWEKIGYKVSAGLATAEERVEYFNELARQEAEKTSGAYSSLSGTMEDTARTAVSTMETIKSAFDWGSQKNPTGDGWSGSYNMGVTFDQALTNVRSRAGQYSREAVISTLQEMLSEGKSYYGQNYHLPEWTKKYGYEDADGKFIGYMNDRGGRSGTVGYASGGQFMVGGSGGTDSQLVQFMASPNERVTVETPAQQEASDARKGRFGNRPIAVSIVVNAKDVDSFRRSKKQVLAKFGTELAAAANK